MHEKNLEMKHLREVMEKKMKDQLVRFCYALLSLLCVPATVLIFTHTFSLLRHGC
jgi:hypothetical protein